MQTDPASERATGLATRCTACGTAFRVVQDQLKVSEGWVRCGQCSAVFNALEGLFDLEVSGSAPPPDPSRPPPGEADIAEQDTVRSELDTPPGTPVFDPAAAADPRHGPTAEWLVGPEAPSASGPASESSALAQGIGAGHDEFTAAEAGAVSDVEPEFVRQSRPTGPVRRALPVVAATVLAGLLVAQAVRHDRDDIAARWPQALPALATGCAVLACSIQTPRHIDAIVVESSTLTRHAPIPDSYRLAVVVRNRSALAAAMPSIDLTLTDAGGQIVARRMLAPDDFRIRSMPISAGAEASWQALLSIGSPRVSGYTVEAFYP